jgi:hypothetical protein
LKYISIPSSVPVQFLKRPEGRLGEKWIKECVGMSGEEKARFLELGWDELVKLRD